ncbi:MAG: FAD-dependent oxidoreductase, partial [Deltaproteobacteria bacterium]|nr:FAD-dependent oxidoreductase [Deltaproteobacteria bacterium]
QEAGFRGVEISTSASHFLPTFLNRFWNQREDQYGSQSIENRARLMCEIIHESKERVGEGFNIGVMMNVVESMPGGLTYPESIGIAMLFEAAGAAYIHGRAFIFASATTFWPEQEFHPELTPQAKQILDLRGGGKAAFRKATAKLKEALSIPVMTVGNIDPETGEDILRRGEADLIGLCRPLMADPQLPNKLAEDRPEDITPCTHCMACLQRWIVGRSVACRVNASVGDVDRYTPAEQSKRLLVVGAGPAGMEAARVAARRGHRVTLIDRERALGGQMLLASAIKGKEPENLEELIEYYRIQLSKLSVGLQLGTEYSAELLQTEQPDAVVFATGPTIEPIAVPAGDSKIVVHSASLMDALKRAIRAAGAGAIHTLSKAWLPLGDRVVIVGGGYQGCQLAEFLIKRGRKVSLVEKGPTIGDGVVPHNLMKLMFWFQSKGVGMITEAEIESIAGSSVSLLSGDQRHSLEADSVIFIDTPVPNARHVDEASNLVGEVHRVGGSREPGMILDSIADGYRIGHLV